MSRLMIALLMDVETNLMFVRPYDCPTSYDRLIRCETIIRSSGWRTSKFLGVFGPFGPRVGGCVSVGVYIGIVYIMPTIGICVSCWVSVVVGFCGPFGPWVGGFMSIGVYISIVYIMPTIGCVRHENIITDSLQPRAFQKYSTWWGLLPLHHSLYLCICVFVYLYFVFAWLTTQNII